MWGSGTGCAAGRTGRGRVSPMRIPVRLPVPGPMPGLRPASGLVLRLRSGPPLPAVPLPAVPTGTGVASGRPARGDRRPVLDRGERRPAVPVPARFVAEPHPRRRVGPRRHAVGSRGPHPRCRPPGRAAFRCPRGAAAAAGGPPGDGGRAGRGGGGRCGRVARGEDRTDGTAEGHADRAARGEGGEGRGRCGSDGSDSFCCSCGSCCSGRCRGCGPGHGCLFGCGARTGFGFGFGFGFGTACAACRCTSPAHRTPADRGPASGDAAAADHGGGADHPGSPGYHPGHPGHPDCLFDACRARCGRRSLRTRPRGRTSRPGQASARDALRGHPRCTGRARTGRTNCPGRAGRGGHAGAPASDGGGHGGDRARLARYPDTGAAGGDEVAQHLARRTDAPTEGSGHGLGTGTGASAGTGAGTGVDVGRRRTARGSAPGRHLRFGLRGPRPYARRDRYAALLAPVDRPAPARRAPPR